VAQKGKIVEKLLGPFPSNEDIKDPFLIKWFGLLQLGLAKTQSYSVSLNLASVAADSYSRQTVTVSGLTTRDIVSVNAPSLTADLHFLSARVSGTDTLEVTLYNDTASPIDEGAATWLILATRR